MAFDNMWRELAGTVPKLSPFLAQTYIRRAWRDICNERNWAFKQETFSVVCPPMIQVGTVTATLNTLQMQADATMQAAINAVVATNPNPPIEGRQIRTTGWNQMFTIESYSTATGLITLTQPYTGPSGAGQTYQLYKAYYTPPVEAFQKYRSIMDPNNAYAMTRMHVPRAALDRKDPTRSSQGLAYFQVDWGADNSAGGDGAPVSEFWPHPTSGQTFVCAVLTLGTALLQPTDVLPTPVPEGLVISRALSRYAIPWGITNQGRFDELRTTNFASLLKMAREDYLRDLQMVKLIDNGMNLASTRIVRNSGRFSGPIDSNYFQAHDMNWFMGWGR